MYQQPSSNRCETWKATPCDSKAQELQRTAGKDNNHDEQPRPPQAKTRQDHTHAFTAAGAPHLLQPHRVLVDIKQVLDVDELVGRALSGAGKCHLYRRRRRIDYGCLKFRWNGGMRKGGVILRSHVQGTLHYRVFQGCCCRQTPARGALR